MHISFPDISISTLANYFQHTHTYIYIYVCAYVSGPSAGTWSAPFSLDRLLPLTCPCSYLQMTSFHDTQYISFESRRCGQRFVVCQKKKKTCGIHTMLAAGRVVSIDGWFHSMNRMTLGDKTWCIYMIKFLLSTRVQEAVRRS